MKNILFCALITTTALASPVPQPDAEQGETWSAEDTANVDSVMMLMRKKLIEDTGNGVMKRDAHPKHHGCVKGKLNIDSKDLPEDLRVGLFEKSASYGALVRFSNGDQNPNRADKKGDARGLALKVFGVPYDNYLTHVGAEPSTRVHDFVFMTSKAFFINDTETYAKLLRANDKGGLHVVWFAITHPAVIKALLKISLTKVNSPLDPDYHSATPYKLGSTSMKMKFESCREYGDTRPRKPGRNFLSDKLADALKKEAACFDFYLQPNKDPERNRIENPMRAWSSSTSPFVKVGRLEIPVQDGIHTTERQEFCENVSFNPWRAALENRPLGAVNRTRLEVYFKQARFRQDHNKVRDPMPTDLADIP